MQSINVDWAQIKSFATARNISIQYVDYNGNYYLSAIDGGFSLQAILSQEDPSNADLIDFETNFKPTGNKKLDPPKDSDGSILQRIKVTASGWSLHYHGLELVSSSLTGSVDKDHNNADTGFLTVKLYDADDVQITDEAYVNTCVKTVIDWEPTFSYDIIGGDVFMHTVPSTDIRISVIGVPDIPALDGGTKVFMTGFNLKYVPSDGIHLDGKTPKSTTYTPGMHTNKIRFIMHHDAGVSQAVMVMLNIFKA